MLNKDESFLKKELNLILKKIKELKIEMIEIKYNWIEMMDVMFTSISEMKKEIGNFILKEEKTSSIETDLLNELSKIDQLENELKVFISKENQQNEEITTISRQKKIMIKQLKKLKK